MKKTTKTVKVNRKPLKLISLYTGAGGLDHGLEAAGFRMSVAVEMDRWSCETLRLNRPTWKIIEADIHDVSSQEILDVAQVKAGDVDLLIGGPPCQPFSKAAYWARGDTRRLDDPRADTLSGYLRVLRDTKPKVFLLENVFGLAYKSKDEGLRLLQSTIGQINSEEGTNYSFNWRVLNAADHGVPQLRERVFIVGARDGREFEFPEPTHFNPDAKDQDLFGFLDKHAKPLSPWVTAWEAIGDLEDKYDLALNPGGYWGELLPSIPEGKNYLYHTNRDKGENLFGWRTRYWSFLLKLAKNKPSWTIQAQPGSAIGPFHWRSRRLSIQEMCRLQTFPDGYQICGGRTEAQRQIGNAVPSLMGEVLGREIRRQLLDRPLRSKRLRLAIDRTNAIPDPEPLRPVPKKYLKHIGDHEPHPGTGRGPTSGGRSAPSQTSASVTDSG